MSGNDAAEGDTMSITTKEQDFATFCVWARDRGFKALRYRETPESLISRYGQKKAISVLQEARDFLKNDPGRTDEDGLYESASFLTNYTANGGMI